MTWWVFLGAWLHVYVRKCALHMWKAFPVFPFISQAWRHPLVPPSAQTLSLFLCGFSSFFHSVQQFSLRSPPTHFLFIPNSLPRFFPCLFSQIHKPQQSHIPWLCSFSKPHFKNKLITPPTHGITLRKQRAKKKTSFYFYFFQDPLFLCWYWTVGALLQPSVSVPTASRQSDEQLARGQSQNDSVGLEPDWKRG